ncbi:putative death-receptor fusion protein-domain-containing protein [Xylariomycetidae sp. FL2044]|nr:putative death-receptor fusion protein-domain-containing protein [Xylariomycetidae sp. FL2044]
MEHQEQPGVEEVSFNPKTTVAWLEQQTPDNQARYVRDIFQQLLSGASKPKQSSGNACVKLCGFVDQCLKSGQPTLRDFAFDASTALSLFEFFMEWNEKDSHRSMRLVLDIVMNAISHNVSPQAKAHIKKNILNEAISAITQRSSKPSVKSAMTVLDYALQKKVLYLDEILGIYRNIHAIPSTCDVTWDDFISRVFTWMELHYVCPIAGKLLVSIFTSPWYEDQEVRHRWDAWHRFLCQGLQMNPQFLEPIKHYIFVPLFKADRDESLKYLEQLSSLQGLTGQQSKGWDLNAMLWLALLEAGKKIGFVNEPIQGPKEANGPTAQIRVAVLEDILCHESREARSSGVSILLASPSTTRPYTADALALLKKHLPSYHEDSDAKFRYDVFGHSRNMIKRMHGVIESLRKELGRASRKLQKVNQGKDKDAHTTKNTEDFQEGKPQKNVSEVGSVLSQHENFVTWYAEFLKGELAPTVSYQRHITALRAMSFLLKSDLMSVSIPKHVLVDDTWFRAILDLIMDPFDDVRETAASLILMLGPTEATPLPQTETESIQHRFMDVVRSFCRKADKVAQMTARADHSDGVARSYEVLCRWSGIVDQLQLFDAILTNLEFNLSAAENDLADAVLHSPVHGNFATLCYMWGCLSRAQYSEEELASLNVIQDRMIQACQRIWETVRHVLCDDSPEGHLPEELEDVQGLDTKDLLSYSFRAIHESSNLLRVIASKARGGDRAALVPLPENFRVLGRLTFDQLSNLRHRGAFTTVSQTFTTCCQLVENFPTQSDEARGLLEEWYQGALNCIDTQASTTRRSAGIPAIIVGILHSHTDSPSFQEVFCKLQDIAQQPALVTETDGSNLPQVHALNCLKDIFKNSHLSQIAEEYLTECLQLAANCLKSEVWAIRNCGLLLLRSLIDCLFGTSESKSSMEAGWDGRSVRIPYHKYKALPPLLVNLLETGQESAGVLIGSRTAEAVFPALDIIRRAGPPENLRDKLYGIIAWYLSSRIWHIREIAARTICSFLLGSDWLESIRCLVRDAGTSANGLHGALLTLKFLIEKLAEVMPDELSGHSLRSLHDFLESIAVTNFCLSNCPEATAVYLDITNLLARLEILEDASETNPRLGISQKELTSLTPNLNDRDNPGIAPLALLKTRLGEGAVQKALQLKGTGMGDRLTRFLTSAVKDDANVACSMLETIANDNFSHIHEAWPDIANAYVQLCLQTSAPEPRSLALDNLAVLLDLMLQNDALHHVPSNQALSELWANSLTKPMNPSISDAIIRVSGPIIATLVSRNNGQISSSVVEWLRNWGAMMSDAGVADRTFDTRLAAVRAINSFTSKVNLVEQYDHPLSEAHIPWLLALYDSLNDDDDEIREAAAEAAAPILGRALVSVEAGQRLLDWLAVQFKDAQGFRAHVVSRMIGHYQPVANNNNNNTTSAAEGTTALLDAWVPAHQQLASAMRFDDSLFVIEEQNLYIDEVRETKRWSNVYTSLPLLPQSSERAAAAAGASRDDDEALRAWTLAGLRTLMHIAEEPRRDDALGWTSKPEVFAICARILTCAAVLAAAEEDEKEEEEGQDREVGEALRGFMDVGGRTGVHGLLLGIGR